ncbi:hypothetical protein J698_3717 [Acinetobacter baumannii 1494580]|nr:hypothetical protein J698_3717 [Acinetobacter baumannii 1494580]
MLVIILKQTCNLSSASNELYLILNKYPLYTIKIDNSLK